MYLQFLGMLFPFQKFTLIVLILIFENGCFHLYNNSRIIHPGVLIDGLYYWDCCVAKGGRIVICFVVNCRLRAMLIHNGK